MCCRTRERGAPKAEKAVSKKWGRLQCAAHRSLLPGEGGTNCNIHIFTRRTYRIPRNNPAPPTGPVTHERTRRRLQPRCLERPTLPPHDRCAKPSGGLQNSILSSRRRRTLVVLSTHDGSFSAYHRRRPTSMVPSVGLLPALAAKVGGRAVSLLSSAGDSASCKRGWVCYVSIPDHGASP